MLEKIYHLIKRFREEKNPLKFLLSRILRITKLSRFFLIKRNGYLLRFHPTALSCTLWLNTDERLEDEDFLRAYLKSGDTFIDIGANIGSLTLTAASVVGSQGKVLAFETHPITAAYLKNNIELNSFSNITLFNIALSDQPGEVGFSNLISDDQNFVSTSPNSLTVKALPLDDIPLPNQLITLLKIDVEGYEKTVLLGAAKTLHNIECIYFEASESAYQRFGYSFLDIYSLLNQNGFTILKWQNQHVEFLSKDYQCIKTENVVAVKDVQKFLTRINDSSDTKHVNDYVARKFAQS